MTLPLFTVDAFTTEAFRGNPAAVVLLERPATPVFMQAVAAEMNLAETAFVVLHGGGGERHALRWFTPTTEVPLCGHATLASAGVLFTTGRAKSKVAFDTASGVLEIEDTRGGELSMSFPAYRTAAVREHSFVGLVEALGLRADDVREVRLGLTTMRKLLVEVNHRSIVERISPRFSAMLQAENPDGVKGVIVAARDLGGREDFVSRFFAPWVGIDEDPVTGSAHCVLAPYFADELGKTRMRARQLSRRGGELGVETKGDRVILSGAYVVVARGELCV